VKLVTAPFAFAGGAALDGDVELVVVVDQGAGGGAIGHGGAGLGLPSVMVRPSSLSRFESLAICSTMSRLLSPGAKVREPTGRHAADEIGGIRRAGRLPATL
jgi:hypothetical protein